MRTPPHEKTQRARGAPFPHTHELGAAQLRERARAFVTVGILPRFTDQALSGGLGPDAKCALCLHRIHVEDLRYVIRRPAGGALFELHVACFLAWEHASVQIFA